MKTIGNLALVAIAACSLLATSVPAGEPAWFDMENCSFCKHLVEDPQLLEHMTWESHPIDRGLLMVTTVAPEYEESYHNAMAAMEELGGKMQSGAVDPASVTMCGSCQTYGNLLMAGAEVEMVETAAGDITLMTAEDPQLVARIQAYGQRNTEEMAKLESSATGHHEH